MYLFKTYGCIFQINEFDSFCTEWIAQTNRGDSKAIPVEINPRKLGNEGKCLSFIHEMPI